MKSIRFLLPILLLLLCSSAAWADQKTAIWDAHDFGSGDDVTKLTSSSNITVSLTNICISSQIKSNRNFQCKDYKEGSFTVTAPDGYLIRSIKIYDDYKDGRDMSTSNANYSPSTSSTSCELSIIDGCREVKSLTCTLYKGTKSSDKDGTNFQYLKVVCVKDVSISFGQSTYYIYANGGDYSPSLNLNGHDGTVEYKSGDSKIGKYADGKVTPVKAGTIIINATCKGNANYARSNEAATTVYINRDKMFFKWDENYDRDLLTNGVDQSTSIATLSMTTGSQSGKWTSNSDFTVSSSDDNVLSATLSGNKIYLYHKGKDGEATITVTQAQTDIYEKTTGSITFNVIQTDQNGEKNVTIGSLDDWNSFVSLVKDTPVPVNAKLTADVDLGTTFNQAKAKGGYTGVFDGNNHSLTFNWSSTDGTPALFYKVKSATFKNLTINGSATGLYASGLAYSVTDTCTVLNCVSNVAATASSWQLSSGFFVWISGGATIEDCVDNSTGGGMAFLTELGDKSYINLINCLYSGPANTKFPNQTFSDPNLKITNSYTLNHAGYKNLPKVTEDQMKSGEIAHKLQNGRATQVWGQTIGTDAFPHFSSNSSEKVCQVIYTYRDLADTLYVNNGQPVPYTPSAKDLAGDSYNPHHHYAPIFYGDFNRYSVTADIIVPVSCNEYSFYEIIDYNEWKLFCRLVNGGQPELDAILKNDITLNDIVMAGDDTHRYSGTFNGNNHIITLNWDNSGEAAPFAAISGATIQKLKIDGHNYGARTAGFALDAYKDNLFFGCSSNVFLTSTTGNPGGFVSNITDGSLTFTNCIDVSDGAVGFFSKSTSSSDTKLNLNSSLYLGTANALVYHSTTVNNKNSYQMLESGYGLTAATQDQIKSGEITFLLNNSDVDYIWVQNIDNDQIRDFIPKLWYFAKDHGQVYRVATNCTGTTFKYSNSNQAPTTITHDGDYNATTGVCDRCGAYGSLNDPVIYPDGKSYYEIANAGQMAAFRDLVNSGDYEANAILTADIDLSPVCHPADATKGLAEVSWTPIAIDSYFEGNFFGNGKKITGLYINSTSRNQAFFYRINGRNSTIEDIDIEGSVTSTSYNVAILIAMCDGCNFKRCIARGTVKGAGNVSGLVAQATSTNFDQCANYAQIESTNSKANAAGITSAVGAGIQISNCANYGDIIAIKNAGSIVGEVIGVAGYNLQINNCFNYGTISGGNGNGYFIGEYNTSSDVKLSISNCYSISQSTDMNAVGVGIDQCSISHTDLKSADEVKSGMVTYLLNNSTSSADNLWVQNLDNGQPVDATPMLKAFANDHGLVYQVNDGYTNIDPNPVLPGDANGDGTVTITDALAVVYHVLNKTVENFNEAAADMDNSGDISITDALAIVKSVLGSSASAKQVNDVIEDMLDPQ